MSKKKKADWIGVRPQRVTTGAQAIAYLKYNFPLHTMHIGFNYGTGNSLQKPKFRDCSIVYKSGYQGKIYKHYTGIDVHLNFVTKAWRKS